MHRMDQYFMRFRTFYEKVKKIIKFGTLGLSKMEMQGFPQSVNFYKVIALSYPVFGIRYI